MFYFVVRYLRWAARVPGLPHLFDALLLTGTCVLRRSRLAAMEKLEFDALRLPGVRLKLHRFGGMEFVDNKGRELGHLHGNGLLDVSVGREAASVLLADGRVREHHVFPHSKWVSFQIRSKANVPFALELLTLAQSRSFCEKSPLDREGRFRHHLSHPVTDESGNQISLTRAA